MQLISWASQLVSALLPSPVDTTAIEAAALKEFSLPRFTAVCVLQEDELPRQALPDFSRKSNTELPSIEDIKALTNLQELIPLIYVQDQTIRRAALSKIASIPEELLPSAEDIARLQEPRELLPLLNTGSFKVRQAAMNQFGYLPLSDSNVQFLKTQWNDNPPEIVWRLRAALPNMVFNSLPDEIRDPDLSTMVSVSPENLKYCREKICSLQLSDDFDASLALLKESVTELDRKAHILILLTEHFDKLRVLNLHIGSYANSFCSDYLNAIRDNDQEKLQILEANFQFNCKIGEHYLASGGTVKPKELLEQIRYVERMSESLNNQRVFADECKPWIPIINEAVKSQLEQYRTAKANEDIDAIYELAPPLSIMYRNVIARLFSTPFPAYKNKLWNDIYTPLIEAVAAKDTTRRDAMLDADKAARTLIKRCGQEHAVSWASVEAMFSLYKPALSLEDKYVATHTERVAVVIEYGSNNLRQRLRALDAEWLQLAVSRYDQAVQKNPEDGLRVLLEIEAYLLAAEKLTDLTIALNSTVGEEFIQATIENSVSTNEAKFSESQNKAISRVRQRLIQSVGLGSSSTPDPKLLEELLEGF